MKKAIAIKSEVTIGLCTTAVFGIAAAYTDIPYTLLATQISGLITSIFWVWET